MTGVDFNIKFQEHYGGCLLAICWRSSIRYLLAEGLLVPYMGPSNPHILKNHVNHNTFLGFAFQEFIQAIAFFPRTS